MHQEKREMQQEKREMSRENVTYKDISIWLWADISAETLQGRREWDETFKMLKEKSYQPRTVYLAKLILKNEQEV